MYKDLITEVSTCDFEETTLVNSLPDKKVFHVTDLLNTASSFERAWVPAILNLGSRMHWAIYPVDRNQGGNKCLENLQVAPLSLITLNEDLFELAFNKGIISANQKDILNKYFEDPEKTMQDFIKNSEIQEAKNERIKSLPIIQNVIKDLNILHQKVTNIKQEAEAQSDYATSSMIDNYLCNYSKKLWMLNETIK